MVSTLRIRHAMIVIMAVLALGVAVQAGVAQGPGIRLSYGIKIVSIQPGPGAASEAIVYAEAAEAGIAPLVWQPPVQGFLPRVAITTSDARSTTDFDFEHQLAPSYTGRPLNAPAEENFVIGVLDTGSQVDLVAGTHAQRLGFAGRYLSPNTFPIGGVSGTLEAAITRPIGFFAAGLGAVGADGRLDLSQVVGHTNVCALASPSIGCDNGEEITATVGSPLLAFYTSVIRQDRQRRVVVGDQVYVGPDVQIVGEFDVDPNEYPHRIPVELGGLSPVTTASYYGFPDFDDIFGDIEPLFPTLLSMFALSIPMGGSFFTEMGVLRGEPGPLNTLQTLRVMVDTGAQASIISSTVAARLNLPLEPDFTAQVCGLGGMSEVPGYYVDYARINAMGGALEFSRVPFVVIDIESPEGGPLDGILGTNFFWNRNLVLQPISSGSAFLHVSNPVPYAFVDLNGDGTVDLADFAVFAAAWRATPQDPAWNRDCDLFVDEVIDGRDLEAFIDAWVHAQRAAGAE